MKRPSEGHDSSLGQKGSQMSNNDEKSIPVNGSPSSPFDELFSNIDNLRISQDFESGLGIKRALLTVPLRKPSKEWWFRTHPEMEVPTGILELKEDSECYMVAPVLWPLLSTEPTFSTRMLVGTINKQNVFFIWPLRLPGSDGKVNEWHRSALSAAAMAKSRWVRMAANRSLGAYEIFPATSDYAPPQWPTEPFVDLLKIAFRNFYIDSWDHAVLKRLRGEH